MLTFIYKIYKQIISKLHIPDHIETGDGSGVLGGGALSVVKVGGDGDDGVRDVLAQVVLGDRPHLREDGGGDLLGGELLLAGAARRDADGGLSLFLEGLEREVLDVVLDGAVAPVAADEPLGVEDGVLGVRRQLVLGRVADQALALFRERHVGRGDPVALVVGDDVDAAVPHYSDAARLGKY